MFKVPSIIAALGLCLSISAVQATSLYQESNYRGLVTDAKAAHVGDSLTILVVEDASAQTSTDTDSNESSDLSASLSTPSNTESVGVNTNADYQNGGSINRSGKLLARITVTVHEILPTGELRVKGEQKITINKETQNIYVAGNIRPRDISAENTVLSTRVANATIKYQGKGFVSDEEPGVLTRFFRWLF